jgi:membrane protease YdiL (CAAX protease family)
MKPLYQKIGRVIWAGVLGLMITFAASGTWGVLLTANLRLSPAAPWSVVPMAGLLWLFWRYLGGSGWPRSSADARRLSRRANPISRQVLAWSLLAGVLAVAALAGYWIVLAQLQPVRMRPDAFSDLSRYPLLTVALVIAMGSLNSPVTEEAGFRGYCQTRLEREFRPAPAVAVSSFFFMLAHLNQGVYWPKLLVFYLAGLTFGTIAYLANSILASIPPHVVGDLTFFIFIWPRDAARPLIRDGGANAWFWIHAAQALICTALAILAFRRLARVSLDQRAASSMVRPRTADVALQEGT